MRLARPSSLDPLEATQPDVSPHPRKPRLGERLIARGLLTQDQLAVALRQQRVSPKLIGQILVDAGFVAERDLIDTLAEASGFARVHLSQLIIDPALIEAIPRDVARRLPRPAGRPERGGSTTGDGRCVRPAGLRPHATLPAR